MEYCYFCYLFFQNSRFGHGHPLKRGKWLGDKTIQTDGDVTDPFLGSAGLQETVFNFFTQTNDGLDVIAGFVDQLEGMDG